MKSIKIITITALCTLAFSCKKNDETQDSAGKLSSAEAKSLVSALSTEENPEDEMLKKAKSRPLTTAAFGETDFIFGDIKKGKKVSHTFEVTNTGQNPLVISNVKPGCGCTIPEYTKDPILPGKKGKITLLFDSSNFDGVVYKVADVYANLEKVPVRLTFSANINP